MRPFRFGSLRELGLSIRAFPNQSSIRAASLPYSSVTFCPTPRSYFLLLLRRKKKEDDDGSGLRKEKKGANT